MINLVILERSESTSHAGNVYLGCHVRLTHHDVVALFGGCTVTVMKAILHVSVRRSRNPDVSIVQYILGCIVRGNRFSFHALPKAP